MDNSNPFLDSTDKEPNRKNRLHIRDDAERATENSMREQPMGTMHINERTLKNMNTDAIPEAALMNILDETDDEDDDTSIHDEEQH